VLYFPCQSESGWPGVETGIINGAQRPLAAKLALFLRPHSLQWRVVWGSPCGWPVPIVRFSTPAQSAALARVETGSDGFILTMEFVL